jgi:hypothetical protein
MKRITKVLILFLVLCLLVPFVASCNKNNNNNNNNNNSNNNNNNNNNNTEVTTDPEDEIEMPEVVDMDGYMYKAYVRKFAGSTPDALQAQLQNGNNRYECIDFWVDEANSSVDAISAAVYRRNKQIESTYKCTIQQIASDGSQIEHLLACYTNGDGYDLTIIMAKAAAQAATQNLLRNLKDMKYLDLTHEAFDQNSINELSVADKLYFLSGDMNVSTMEVAGLSIVNMEFYERIADGIVEAFGNDTSYADIYNIVKNKKWTMDTMMTIAEKANVDLNQDLDKSGLRASPIDYYGNETHKSGDSVGYFQYYNSTLWYFYASGGRITTKTEEGLPEMVIGTDTAQTLYDYLYENFNRKVKVPWIPHDASAVLNANFLTGNVLFMDVSLFEIRTELYANADFEYGILPNPVLEEGMEYRSLIYFNNWAHLWAIPSMLGAQSEEYAQRMMQILAVYSSLPDSTMSAYYDRTICFTAAKDNNSREIMDTIRTSMIYDLALLYPSWGELETILTQIPNKEAPEYAGIKDGLDMIIIAMEETIDQLRNPGEYE